MFSPGSPTTLWSLSLDTGKRQVNPWTSHGLENLDNLGSRWHDIMLSGRVSHWMVTRNHLSLKWGWKNFARQPSWNLHYISSTELNEGNMGEGISLTCHWRPCRYPQHHILLKLFTEFSRTPHIGRVNMFVPFPFHPRHKSLTFLSLSLSCFATGLGSFQTGMCI